MTKKHIINEYKACKLCPRNCGTNRYLYKGYCGESSSLKVAKASLHLWEEPCISGDSGSGTIFFSGCNMGCVFCQNKTISRGEIGKQIDTERLTDIFFELKEKGANNINLVTGDMFIPTILIAVEKAKAKNFNLPFILNTSSYINVDTVKSLEGIIDIYLADFKYIRDIDSIRYSNAPGYTEAAKSAISEMVRQKPECEFYENRNISSCKDSVKLLKSGVIVRHLLMPNMLIQAKMIVKYLYDLYRDNIFISLMNQYTPNSALTNYPEISRKVLGREYKSLVSYAQNLGISNAYIQIGETANESFIPEFDCSGV